MTENTQVTHRQLQAPSTQPVPLEPGTLDDTKYVELGSVIEEIHTLLIESGLHVDDAKALAFKRILSSPILEPFRQEAQAQTKKHIPELTYSLARARLNAERVRRETSAPTSSGTPVTVVQKQSFFVRLREVFLIPWVLATCIGVGAAYIAVEREISTHRFTKVFDADYERTVGIVRELTNLDIAVSGLKSDLMGEEQIPNELDGGRIRDHIKVTDALADTLTRETSLLPPSSLPSTGEALAAVDVEIQRLKFCLDSRLGTAPDAKTAAEKVLRESFRDRLSDKNLAGARERLDDRLHIEYPCGANFDNTRFGILRASVRAFLFSKLGSRVFAETTK
jgi:hypothetical protein